MAIVVNGGNKFSSINLDSVGCHVEKVAFYTLGCRLNSAETGDIAQGFAERGYEIVPFGTPCDVTFINTCTVTDGADSSCRHIIRRAHRTSPTGEIVVAGCYAQMDPERLERMQGVSLVLGTQEKYKVFDYLSQEKKQKVFIDQTSEFWGAATGMAQGKTRAFLKIQDGCNYICSFCIIPFSRGRSRTISLDTALEQAQKLISQGFKEIVLTGVNIGEYEKSSGEKLATLVSKLGQLPGLERLRLSSVEPNTLSDELLEVLQQTPSFCPHFHIPLQSGDDAILKSMRRKYDIAYYQNLVEKIKTSFPHASIGADIIVGYPGETKEQFLNTYSLLRDYPLTHFHVFPFSKRQNTTAARLPEMVVHHEKKRRVKVLQELGAQKRSDFAKEQKLKRKTFSVLFEQQKDDLWIGYTKNYLKVEYSSTENLKNKIVEVSSHQINLK